MKVFKKQARNEQAKKQALILKIMLATLIIIFSFLTNIGIANADTVGGAGGPGGGGGSGGGGFAWFVYGNGVSTDGTAATSVAWNSVKPNSANCGTNCSNWWNGTAETGGGEWADIKGPCSTSAVIWVKRNTTPPAAPYIVGPGSGFAQTTGDVSTAISALSAPAFAANTNPPGFTYKKNYLPATTGYLVDVGDQSNYVDIICSSMPGVKKHLTTPCSQFNTGNYDYAPGTTGDTAAATGATKWANSGCALPCPIGKTADGYTHTSGTTFVTGGHTTTADDTTDILSQCFNEEDGTGKGTQYNYRYFGTDTKVSDVTTTFPYSWNTQITDGGPTVTGKATLDGSSSTTTPTAASAFYQKWVNGGDYNVKNTTNTVQTNPDYDKDLAALLKTLGTTAHSTSTLTASQKNALAEGAVANVNEYTSGR